MSNTHKEQYNSFVVDGLKLFSLSDFHKEYSLKEFTHYFLYPLNHKKIRFFYEDSQPKALVTWCFLSQEKSDAFFEDEYTIQEEDYIADHGDQHWCIEYIAPYNNALKVARGMQTHFRDLYPGYHKTNWKRFGRPIQKGKGYF
jgi:hemolysin-activating ACP:hemolysin acyltransferase